VFQWWVCRQQIEIFYINMRPRKLFKMSLVLMNEKVHATLAHSDADPDICFLRRLPGAGVPENSSSP